MRWSEFSEAAPELAAAGRRRLEATGLCLVGSIRKDGSPRISPCEVFFVHDEPLLGMMWMSRKARDLLRDPRLVLHSATCDRDGGEGDFKLYGRAVDVLEPNVREDYADAVHARTNWRPPDPYHLFAVDVRSAGFIRFGENRRAMRWTPELGFELIRHPDD